MTAVALLSPDELQSMLETAAQRGAERALEQLQPRMTLAEVATLVGRSTRTVQRMVEAGEFPRPVDGRWRRSDVSRWITRRV